jgi:hypothetical protein
MSDDAKDQPSTPTPSSARTLIVRAVVTGAASAAAKIFVTWLGEHYLK